MNAEPHPRARADPLAGPARWRRLAALLAEPGPARFIDAPPAGLAADLELAALLAQGAAPASCECRVLIFDATRPGVCRLGDVVGVIPPPPSAIRCRWTAARWDRNRDGALSSRGGAMTAADVRAAVLEAHAVVVVVDYREVVADERRAQRIAGIVAPWLRLAAEWTAPELLTLAVDAVEWSNSVPESRLGWTRRVVRDRLALPDGWPAEGITEMSTARAFAAIGREARGAAPPGFAERERADQGVDAVLDRTIGPFDRDPAHFFALAAMSTARASFRRAATVLGEMLAARPADPGLDPDGLSSGRSAGRRQAWLVAEGLAGSLATAGDTLSDALDELRAARPT